MIADGFGSLAWGERSGGRLTTGERRALIRRVAPEVAAFAGSRVRLLTGRGTRNGTASLHVPDTALARAIEDVARERQSRPVYGHALRTMAFARAIAALDGADVDDELLWCACVVHDVALEHPEPGVCFAVRGGRIARDTALAAGAPAEAATAIGDAVSMHATPGLGTGAGSPGALVGAGAVTDLLGRRREDLSPAFVAQVHESWPRDGVAAAIADAWVAEARAVPEGRAALLRRWACFAAVVRVTPGPRRKG